MHIDFVGFLAIVRKQKLRESISCRLRGRRYTHSINGYQISTIPRLAIEFHVNGIFHKFVPYRLIDSRNFHEQLIFFGTNVVRLIERNWPTVERSPRLVPIISTAITDKPSQFWKSQAVGRASEIFVPARRRKERPVFRIALPSRQLQAIIVYPVLRSHCS